MATVGQWVEGARPRTLPNAIAPVLVGAGAAAAIGRFAWWGSLLALVVALGLIIGVNFANDYSDGIRGTDDQRVGPLRLVGSGLVPPKLVRAVAFGCFGLACVAGVALVALYGRWWLIAIGALCVLGAWFYTGGKRPYGYSGFGEIAVFLFFGLTAVLGTQYVQSGRVSWAGVGGAIGVGAFSAAVLVANNLRDIPTDRETNKKTLAVRLGDSNTRVLYRILVITPLLISVLVAALDPWVLVGFLAAPLAVRCVRQIRSGADGRALIPVLRDTGFAMLIWAGATAVALAFG
ncbi:MAG TPA: 1,4-dihydroxy-2-naphthoate polyprenyltransferase [Pseudonocardiaceae bacterium]|jgi:1,4-dihydroxy-2-naphthoate octaprenyltransferase|nr:1,4-dihydroxy-2-naphthoate polyprenyltransferase [Pseudonocardiaceae bacterium]